MYERPQTRYNAFSKTENDVFNEMDFARLLYRKAYVPRLSAVAIHPEAMAKATDAYK